MATPPNILWIQTDEQRPDSLACYGSPWARTPTADRLAARGTVFTNAVCQAPLCVPSRAAQIFARYPQELGYADNRGVMDPQPPDWQPFPMALRQHAGYSVASFGKRHIPSGHHVSNHVWEQGHAICQFTDVSTYGALAPRYQDADHRILHLPTHGIIVGGTWPGPAGYHPVEHTTDSTISFMEHSVTPFLIRASYEYPHSPVLPPAPWDRCYREQDLPIRAFDQEAFAGRSAYDQRIAAEFDMRGFDARQRAQAWTDYFGLCAYVDAAMGRLLDTLDRLGLAENTIVMLSSDHGRGLGEFGGGQKQVFDDQVWRVPFIWSWPGHLPEGLRRDEPCELIDTARTLFDLCGLAGREPAAWAGRRLFADPAPEAVFGILDRRGGRLRIGVRTTTHRLDCDWDLQGGPLLDDQAGNLIDLVADPLERVNRWRDPAQATLRQTLLGRIAEWLARHPAHPRLYERNGLAPPAERGIPVR